MSAPTWNVKRGTILCAGWPAGVVGLEFREMRHFAVYSLGLLLLLPGALGQSGSTLFGDFEVHDILQGTGAPAAFQILLLNRGLQVIGRETLGPRGRYRFLGVPNGEYYLVIQMEETELLRMLAGPRRPPNSTVTFSRKNPTIRVERSWRATSPST